MAAVAVYLLAVITAMAGAEHAVLLQAGELNATTDEFILPVNALQAGATWCVPVNPQGMSFGIFMLALNPVTWGTRLQAALRQEYCGLPIPPSAFPTSSDGIPYIVPVDSTTI